MVRIGLKCNFLKRTEGHCGFRQIIELGLQGCGNGVIRFLNVEIDHGIVFLLCYLHGNTAHHEDNFVGTGCDVLV